MMNRHTYGAARTRTWTLNVMKRSGMGRARAWTLAPEWGEDHDLQPGTLGFRLVEKDGRPFDVRDVYRSDQGLIVGELVGDIMDTFMYSGDGGQIRSLADRRATIDLDASGLKLLDFAGPNINRIRKELDIAIKKEQLIRSAYETTKSSLQT